MKRWKQATLLTVAFCFASDCALAQRVGPLSALAPGAAPQTKAPANRPPIGGSREAQDGPQQTLPSNNLPLLSGEHMSEEYRLPDPEPAQDAKAEEPKAPPKKEASMPSIIKKGESNPNPHFRRCEKRDLKGTWELVGVAGKAVEVFPSDPQCQRFQWLAFDDANRLRYVYYKDEAPMDKVRTLLDSAGDERTFSIDKRGVLTINDQAGRLQQICMISSADDGQSRAGDMLLSSYQNHQLALIRLFRKISQPQGAGQ